MRRRWFTCARWDPGVWASIFVEVSSVQSSCYVVPIRTVWPCFLHSVEPFIGYRYPPCFLSHHFSIWPLSRGGFKRERGVLAAPHPPIKSSICKDSKKLLEIQVSNIMSKHSKINIARTLCPLFPLVTQHSHPHKQLLTHKCV